MSHAELPRDNPQKIVENGYDSVADRYREMELGGSWPRLKWLRKLLSRIETGAAVLDVGCGAGVPADTLIERSHRVVGIDISGEQIRRARVNVPDGEFIHGDVLDANFDDGAFGAVISFYSVEHIPRKRHKELFDRFRRWTSPGGYLLVSIEAGDYDDVEGSWLGVPMFVSCYPPDVTTGILSSAGFDVMESAIESQVEQDREVPYLWILAQRT